MLIFFTRNKLGVRQFLPLCEFLKEYKIKYRCLVSNKKFCTKSFSNLNIFAQSFSKVFILINKIVKLNINSYLVVGSVIDYILLRFFIPSKKRIIYRARGIIPEESYTRNNSEFRKQILSILEKYVLENCYIVLTVSQNQKKHFIKKYSINSNKIFTVHNYLNSWDYEDKRKSTQDKKFELVYVGSHSNWQKINKFYYLIELLNDKLKNLQFLICSPKKDIKKFENDLNYKNYENVSIKNYNYEDMINRINKSTLGIIMRDNDPINYVSSPFKIIDYLKADLPIIMTSGIGDYEEIFGNKCFVYFIKNLNKLHLEIDKIISFINFCHKKDLSTKIYNFTRENLQFDREFRMVLNKHIFFSKSQK